MIRSGLPPISNRQSWIDDIQIYDDDDGTLIDLTDVTAQMKLIPWRPQQSPLLTGYVTFWDWGSTSDPGLLGTTENGKLVIVGQGTIRFMFTEEDVRSLYPGQWIVSCTITRYGETVHLFLLDIPVLDGVVPS